MHNMCIWRSEVHAFHTAILYSNTYILHTYYIQCYDGLAVLLAYSYMALASRPAILMQWVTRPHLGPQIGNAAARPEP